jgi:RNase P subunit RPR2
MPLCPDCYRDGRLELMIPNGEETVKGKDYVILDCLSCGSSIRVRKETNRQ